MKKLKLLIAVMFLFVVKISPQDLPIAPEVWSEPLLLGDVFNYSNMWEDSPSLSQSFDTLYYISGGVYRSIKSNNRWGVPIFLNNNINFGGYAAKGCSISRDGKRLYFSQYSDLGYGGFDIWKSNCDSTTNDWGPAINMGPVINSSSNEKYFFEVSQDTVYTISHSDELSYYCYDDKLEKWCKIDSFWYHPLGAFNMYGVSITKRQKKMYFGQIYHGILGNFDISVCYWDPDLGYWSNTIFNLNIDTKPDTTQGLFRRGQEYYPWISEDGCVMVFSSNRDVSLHPDSSNNPTFYISYLLIDENGDTVTSVENKLDTQPTNFTLTQNYPNPFNPSTTIEYSLNECGDVKLIIYDALGKRVTVLVNEYKQKGTYKINFNAQKYKLASGIYFYQIIQNGKYIIKKMNLIK